MDKESGSNIWNNLGEITSEHGDLAFGMFLATALNYLFYRLATNEQRKHVQLVLEREKYLDDQLRVKEERISELHKLIRGEPKS